MRRHAVSLLVCSVLGWWAISAAQVDVPIVFRMDYSEAAWPRSNWPHEKTESEGSRFRRVHLGGQAPGRGDAAGFLQTPAPQLSAYGGQFTWGWEGDVDSSNQGFGDRRYYRWWLRVTENSTCGGVSWNDGGPAHSSNKLLIIGAHGSCRPGWNCRFIMNHDCEGSGQRSRFTLGKDGGVDLVESEFSWRKGRWLGLQLELRASSARDVPDGGYSLWVGTDNEAKPTLSKKGIVLNALNFQSVCFGCFSNTGLDARGRFGWEHAGFEIGRTFDASWNQRGNPGR